MKRLITLLLAFIVCGVFCACGGNDNLSEQTDRPEISEETRIVQRKIDKALESESTYSSLKEIRDLYNDLLIAEQEQITNYDKIESMFRLSDMEVAAIYAVNELKERLKNPYSLELISISVSSNDESAAIKVVYSASNDFGGNIDDEFYCLVDTPIYNRDADTWSCKLEDMFETSYELEIINSLLGSPQGPNTSQSYASKEYSQNEGDAVSVDVEKIMDNIDLSIEEIMSDGK